MNRKQRRRRHARRRAHQLQAGRPRNVFSRDSYPTVKQGHIVPKVFQANFAVGDQIALHVNGRCVPANIKDAGTRGPYYRRTRPDGTPIDDIEASLSFIEDAVRPVFDEVLGGQPLTLERKSTLAQFFGVQIVRGPAFFERRIELIDRLVAGLRASDLRPKALAAAGGNPTVVRERVRELYLADTQQFITMLTTSFKIASILGSMRWHLLRFEAPVLAYSDHPVVIWPASIQSSAPFPRQHLGPLDAVEIRVPLSPDLALLMTWADLPDALRSVRADARFAGELNAFTIAQADRQWMHRLGAEPPINSGTFAPLSRAFEPNYSASVLAHSRRRAQTARYLQRVQGKKYLNDIEIVDLQLR
jgi:hypothetical protein